MKVNITNALVCAFCFAMATFMIFATPSVFFQFENGNKASAMACIFFASVEVALGVFVLALSEDE